MTKKTKVSYSTIMSSKAIQNLEQSLSREELPDRGAHHSNPFPVCARCIACARVCPWVPTLMCACVGACACSCVCVSLAGVGWGACWSWALWNLTSLGVDPASQSSSS